MTPSKPELTMKLAVNLGPELACITREDGAVSKAYGGLRYNAGAASAYFSLSWSEQPAEGPSGFGTARGAGIDDFPEFDDLALLTHSDETGRPVGVLTEGWKLLTIEQTHPPTNFNAERAGALFRTAPLEAQRLRDDVVNVMNDARDKRDANAPQDEIIAAGRGFFEAWIEAQTERWQADADSAVAAHELIEFGDPRT